ncbi:MAG: hypothetical protein KGH55_02070 [Nanoarchaeota archaeon]|nr:hypothetical protein [Nanoarchaeota archaeon]
MSLKSLLAQLRESDEFRRFIKENPGAFLCSGFFTIDKEGKDNKQHFDFFSPGKNKVFSFRIEEHCKVFPLDYGEQGNMEKISEDFDIDFNVLEEKIKDKMIAQGINNRLQKLIFSLQKVDGKDFLTGTIFISMFGLIKISIDIKKSKIVDFEKKSLFDLVNIFKKR